MRAHIRPTIIQLPDATLTQSAGGLVSIRYADPTIRPVVMLGNGRRLTRANADAFLLAAARDRAEGDGSHKPARIFSNSSRLADALCARVQA